MGLKNMSSIVVKKMKGLSVCSALLFLSLLFASSVNAVTLKDYPKLQVIVDELVSEGHYTQAELEVVFKNAKVQQSVLDSMTNPAEYKFTWGKYRKLFLQDDRIQQGAEFWKQHQAVFDRAEKEYGVPGSVIAAIVGVESKFGKFKGKHKVLDSLVTLVVGFPRRSKFFASELKHFLILSKENNLDSLNIKGSYAGAVGYPQFISSSYRSYAVDFSGDGVTDLIDQPEDAIGSIANYFVKNGWLAGQPVTSQAFKGVPTAIEELANRKRKVRFSAADLRTKGAVLAQNIPADEKLNVLMLDKSEVYNEPRSNNAYIVRSGDTACAIAERFKIPCSTLFTLNKLNKKGDIFRGQRLKLPPVKESTEVADTSSSSETSSRWKVGGKPIGDKSTEKKQVTQKTTESFNTQAQPVYFYTHENFYVITRYNHSVLYAMAVHDLSVEIAAAKAALDKQ